MAGTKVLLVDDEIDFTEALAERLSGRGFKVETASDGPTALEKTSAADYDAIVLDLQMPGMDGISTLKNLLQNKPEMQVILLTGHGSIQKGVEAAKAGAMEFLEKPVDLDNLIEKIKAAQGNRVVIYEQKMESAMTDLLRAKGW